MQPFGDRIDHNHHCVEAVCIGEFHDEVDTDLLPVSLGYGEWVEQADWLASEDLVSEAGLAGSGVLSDVSQDLWPLVVVGDQLQSLHMSQVACDLGYCMIMHRLRSHKSGM